MTDRYIAATVKVTGRWLPAVLDVKDHTILDYPATEEDAVRIAGVMNRRERARGH